MTSELIIGGVGVVSNVITWLLSKKKYQSEVDHSLINNMKESLEFYKQLSDDNKIRLEEKGVEIDNLRKEVEYLRKQVIVLKQIIEGKSNCKYGKNKDRFDRTEKSDKGGHKPTRE